MAKGSAVLDFVTSNAWALKPDVFNSLTAILHRHVIGDKVDAEAVDAIVAARDDGRPDRRDAGYQQIGGVAVIQVGGVLVKHANMVNGISQPRGTSFQQLSKRLNRAIRDPGTRAILLDIDSPGGTVSGTSGFGDAVAKAAAQKPVWAYAEDMAASAAYWIASQATRVVAGSTAIVGSIGVVGYIEDDMRWLRSQGIDPHTITSAANKSMTDGVSGAFGERGKASAQSEIDRFHALFVGTVARGRGISLEAAAALGTGDVWIGADALEAGLVDAIASFDEVLAELQALAAETTAPVSFAQQGALDMTAATASASSEGENVTGSLVADSGGETLMAEEKTVDPRNLAGVTKAELEAQNPRLAEELREEAARAERTRALEIRQAALPGQDAIAEEQIARGATVDEARKAFLDARRKDEASRPAGEVDATRTPTVVKEDPADEPQSLATMTVAQLDAHIAKTWQDDKELQAKHRSYEAYRYLMIGEWAEQSGQIVSAPGGEV